jgi:hypothetical protein
VDASFSSTPFLGGFVATFAVRDLFDSGFRVPGGYEHTQASIPQGPRALSFGIGFRW